LTKVEVKDKGTIQDVIKDDFLPLKFLSHIESEVVPDLLKQVDFFQQEAKVEEISLIDIFPMSSKKSKDGVEISTHPLEDNQKEFVIDKKTEKTETLANSEITPEMLLVKGGKFKMGDNPHNTDDSFVVNLIHDYSNGISELTNVVVSKYLEKY